MGFGKKIREMKRALIFVVKTEIHEKNLSKRKATGLPMCHWTPRGKNKWFLTPAPEGAKELNNFFHKNKQKIERSE